MSDAIHLPLSEGWIGVTPAATCTLTSEGATLYLIQKRTTPLLSLKSLDPRKQAKDRAFLGE